MSFSETYDTALVVAALAHRGQVRKGTRVPYLMHPLHVSVLLSRFGYGEPLVTAAILHDVLEDMPFADAALQEDFAATFPQWAWTTGTSLLTFRRSVEAFLDHTFGTDVMRLVRAVTEQKNDGGPARSWMERRREQLARLERGAPDEAILKAADALHNVSTMVADVRIGRASLEGRFNASPHQALWYYQEIARLTRERGGACPLTNALGAAVEQLAVLVG